MLNWFFILPRTIIRWDWNFPIRPDINFSGSRLPDTSKIKPMDFYIWEKSVKNSQTEVSIGNYSKIHAITMVAVTLNHFIVSFNSRLSHCDPIYHLLNERISAKMIAFIFREKWRFSKDLNQKFSAIFFSDLRLSFTVELNLCESSE